MRRYSFTSLSGSTDTRVFGFLIVGISLLFVPLERVLAAPLELLPFQSFECLGDECPLDFSDTSGSNTGTSGALARSRSSGQAFQTNNSSATIGMRFQVCDPASAVLQASGIYQGVLRGTGGGINNRGVVRGSLDLRNLTTGEQIALIQTSQHEERGGGPFQTDTTLINAFDFGLIGLDTTVQTEHDLEPDNIYMLGFRLRTEASGSNALSDFNRNVPARFGQLLRLGIELTPNMPDADSDGLYDAWESNGVLDCDDNVLVDLPAFGADPQHKDVFIEYDWLSGEQPDKDSIDQLKGIFADAPVDNPDGETGIRLWIDTGDLTEFGLHENEVFGSCLDSIDNNGDGLVDIDDPRCRVGDDFGGGDEIDLDSVPNGMFVPRLGGDADGNGEEDFYEVRELEFDDDRRAVFHYSMSSPEGPGEDPAIGRSSCEDSIDNDGDGLTDDEDDVDCFARSQGGGGNFFVINARTSSFLHELGHSMGLGHGGRDSENDSADADNCKPNYLSVMNYNFPGGVPADLDGDTVYESKTLDFSPLKLPDGTRANAPLATLVEDQLVETDILDSSDPVHATRFVDGEGIGRTTAANAAIDWNGVDGIEEGTVTVNINRGDKNGLPSDCEERSADIMHPDDETIVAYNDWANLKYRFPVRVAMDSRGPIIYPEPPVSEEETDQVFFASDLSIAKQVAPDPWVAGQLVEYELSVTNHGPNGVPSSELVDNPPEGVSFVGLPENCLTEPSGAVRCNLPAIPVNATETIQLQARLPVIRDCGRQQFATLTNKASVTNLSGRELVLENNQVSLRHRVLCPMFEYAAKFVCGTQTRDDEFSLLAGRYGSVVNIHNPQAEEVFVFVKLALADAAAALEPGEITPIGLVSLDYDEAAAAGCDYVRKVVFDGEDAPEVLDGFLVVQSALSLDVTAVYTHRATSAGEGSIDVEHVSERKFSPPDPQADLIPEIQISDTRCDDNECSFAVRYLVSNVGNAPSGRFSSRAVLQPSGVSIDNDDWPLGLAPGMSESRPFSVDASPAQVADQNEFCIEVDRPADEVEEIDEMNNAVCIDLTN